MSETSTAKNRASTGSAETAADLQDRIGRFARFAFTLSGAIFVAARVLDLTGSSGLSIGDFAAPDRIAYEVALVVLFFSWRKCRGAPMTMPALRVFDAALTIGISACWGMLGWGPGANYPVSLAMPLTHTLIGRSVVVPSTFRRTLWISTVAAVPTVLILVTRRVFVLVPGASFDSVRVVLGISWCGLAIAVAAMNSRTLYGLRRQVIEFGKLGQYTLEEKIGEGGMGIVYRASHAMLRRPTAIKLLSADRAGKDALIRFEREVQRTAMLTHPNTVTVFDYGRTTDGVFYYAMELLEGASLDEIVEIDGPQPEERVIHLLEQVAASLAEAHDAGLIHRDVKPGNILVVDRGGISDLVKVVDFGLVKDVGLKPADEATPEPTVTMADSITGTPLYIAPETITAPETVDARADLYALGAVGYWLLTGTHVFGGRSILEVCAHHLHSVPDAPSLRLGKPVSADLEALLLACLAKKREDRPASAHVLRERLRACTAAGRWTNARAAQWWAEHRHQLRSGGAGESGAGASGAGTSSDSAAVDAPALFTVTRVAD